MQSAPLITVLHSPRVKFRICSIWLDKWCPLSKFRPEGGRKNTKNELTPSQWFMAPKASLKGIWEWWQEIHHISINPTSPNLQALVSCSSLQPKTVTFESVSFITQLFWSTRGARYTESKAIQNDGSYGKKPKKEVRKCLYMHNYLTSNYLQVIVGSVLQLKTAHTLCPSWAAKAQKAGPGAGASWVLSRYTAYTGKYCSSECQHNYNCSQSMLLSSYMHWIRVSRAQTRPRRPRNQKPLLWIFCWES